MQTDTDTLIIGGGLCGLGLAVSLHQQGRDFHLLEARDRFGGRILSPQVGEACFDLGPAWFWPGQPRMKQLTDRLGLRVFDQHAAGILSVEDEKGQVQRGRGFASMQGSWRVSGGMGAITTALKDTIPPARRTLKCAVTQVTKSDNGVQVSHAGGTIHARRVVFALPPRVAATLAFSPALPAPTTAAMTGIATWMAGQAKAIAIYDTPFWRDAGLSGDATSRHGPMVEIHDACPDEGGPFALFGFIGVPPQARRDETELRRAISAQFARLFGPEGAAHHTLLLKDWAFDPMTSTIADLAPLYAHPHYDLPRAMTALWDGRLHFSGTETAPEFGGYLEGALEAGENTLRHLSA